MNEDFLISLIGQYGYFALFFALWLGIIGMPIPDEVIVMTGGAVTLRGLLLPIPAFVITYLGVISGLSLGYVLGRVFGNRVIQWLKKKKRFEKYVHRSEQWMQKYGSAALMISYFFPVIRHVMPYVAGSNNMSFARYALASYSTGFVWTLLFFWLGRVALHFAMDIAMTVHRYSWVLLILLLVIFLLFYLRRAKNTSRRQHEPGH
ncbi:DedA family protein [Paenibacillus silviterrae]|uniref:DedA family protein n=1 Tax=Paenibacillus silviterrae TaxID=3242194 RepID=UPI002542C8AF|nr:DedA family protein [Paenibacillus chinjuensis]